MRQTRLVLCLSRSERTMLDHACLRTENQGFPPGTETGFFAASHPSAYVFLCRQGKIPHLPPLCFYDLPYPEIATTGR